MIFFINVVMTVFDVSVAVTSLISPQQIWGYSRKLLNVVYYKKCGKNRYLVFGGVQESSLHLNQNI